MENLDLMVLRSLRDWRLAGRRAMLVTVTRTWGSSPRPVGSIMALCEDGAVVGSVSGGCIEDDLIYRFTKAYASANVPASQQAGNAEEPKHIPSGPPQQVKYGVTADEAHRFGLPCGGTLELLLEFDPDPQALAELVMALERGELVQREVRLSDGQVTFADGAPNDVKHMSEDVAAFLMWTAEPKLMARKDAGFKAVLFLAVLASLLFLTNKRLWSRCSSPNASPKRVPPAKSSTVALTSSSMSSLSRNLKAGRKSVKCVPNANTARGDVRVAWCKKASIKRA